MTADSGAPAGVTAEFPAVEVRGLRKQFGAQQVLAELSFEIEEGELLVVLGPSGSGKTTLLRILAGIVPPDGGTVAIRGRPAQRVSPQARRFGVVFQEPALFPRLTVEENIAFGLTVRSAAAGRVRERVDGMLRLTRLSAHRRRYPRQLSAGQRQRVAIARALAFAPQAVLFDEPFAALDPVTRVELRREIRHLLRELGVAALFITHDQEEALELADRVLVLNGGRIEQVGTPFELYNRPDNEFVATFLGAANVLLGRWGGGQVAIGPLRLDPPPESPRLLEGQAVKVVFRPEDIVVGFRADLLHVPYRLGSAVVDSVAYIGHSERLIVRLTLAGGGPTGPPDPGAGGGGIGSAPAFIGGFPVTMTRTKWDAAEMELAPGDPVLVGLKAYRLLPHFPLRTESGARVLG